MERVLVVVNSTVYGGAGGTVGTFSLATGAEKIALHELGHTAFGLADEYEYYRGCGRHRPEQPSERRTGRGERNRQHESGDAEVAALCRGVDLRADDQQRRLHAVRPAGQPRAGTGGLSEGAHYYHCGSFRPEFICMMRVLGQPFCAVCRERIRTVLAPYLPAGRALVADFVDGNPPAEVRYWETWGQSTLLDDWHDVGDLLFVGDFRASRMIDGLAATRARASGRSGAGARDVEPVAHQTGSGYGGCAWESYDQFVRVHLKPAPGDEKLQDLACAHVKDL